MTIEIDFTEKDIEDYLCKSGNLMKHLGLRFVARQVDIFGLRIDILAYNTKDRCFYIIELKKGTLDAKAFTQAFKYCRLMNLKYNFGKHIKRHKFKVLLVGQDLNSELIGVLTNYGQFLPVETHYFYTLFNYDFENGISFYWYSKNEREFHNKLKEHLYE